MSRPHPCDIGDPGPGLPLRHYPQPKHRTSRQPGPIPAEPLPRKSHHDGHARGAKPKPPMERYAIKPLSKDEIAAARKRYETANARTESRRHEQEVDEIFAAPELMPAKCTNHPPKLDPPREKPPVGTTAHAVMEYRQAWKRIRA